MQRYHFDLVDTTCVSNAGGALLEDDRQARKVAHDIAHDVRKTRPELIGQGYRISVKTQDGNEICLVAIDAVEQDGL